MTGFFAGLIFHLCMMLPDQFIKIIDIIKDIDYIDEVTFISFIYSNLKKVREILPNQSAQYVFVEITDEEIEKMIKETENRISTGGRCTAQRSDRRTHLWFKGFNRAGRGLHR